MAKGRTYALKCRQGLFRAQVARFRSCELRAPNLSEVRRIWIETGFRTA